MPPEDGSANDQAQNLKAAHMLGCKCHPVMCQPGMVHQGGGDSDLLAILSVLSNNVLVSDHASN